MGVIPGGRGNDLARVLGIPDRAGGRGRRCSPRARCARSTSARSTASAFSASPAAASTPTPTGSPTRRAGQGAASSTPTRPCGRWRPGSRRRSRSRSTATRSELRGYSVAAANSQAYGGGMFVAPDAELDDGLLDVVTTGRDQQAALSHPGLPKVFDGSHVELAEVGRPPRRRGDDRGRPAVRGLRRRRPPHRPAGDGRAAAAGAARDRAAMSPATASDTGFRAKLGARARDRQRSAAAAAAVAERPCRGACCCAWRPTPSRASARELRGGSTVDQRHQRQDDDRRHARRRAARRRAVTRSTTAPART